MEKIDAFNEEEAAYGFELSQYPLRKQVHEKLAPYKKLYDNAVNFFTKRDLWLNSQVGSHDPEEIETEVGTYYRNVYKLEKVFSDRPATHDLTKNVRKPKIRPKQKSTTKHSGGRTNRGVQGTPSDHSNVGKSRDEGETLGKSFRDRRFSYSCGCRFDSRENYRLWSRRVHR